jgi:peptide/nickel transport system permease protein
MTRYLIRRASLALFLVFAASSSAVLLTQLAPGDFVTDARGPGGTADALAADRARLGLDRPALEQYVTWLGRAARFDFGESFMYARPVIDLVPERAANTALLAFTALALATALGLALGTVSATDSRGWVTHAIAGFSLLLVSMPPLLTSLILVWIAARTGWLPIGGMRSSSAAGVSAADLAAHLVIPVLALALPVVAIFERLQANALQETLREPYVQATRARGVPWSRLIWRDAMRPSLRAMASIYGVVLASLLSGSFVVEMMTSWPGLGRLMFDALRSRDMPLVAGCAVAGSLFLSAGTLLSDLAFALIDPRVRE